MDLGSSMMIFTGTLTGLATIAVFDPDEDRRRRALWVLILLRGVRGQRDEGSEDSDEPPDGK